MFLPRTHPSPVFVCLDVCRNLRSHKKNRKKKNPRKVSDVACKWKTSVNENCLSFRDLDMRPTHLKILISSDRAKAKETLGREVFTGRKLLDLRAIFFFFFFNFFFYLDRLYIIYPLFPTYDLIVPESFTSRRVAVVGEVVW